MKLDLSPEGWGRVILSTVLGTAVCVAAALYVDSFNFTGMSESERLRAIITDVLLPIVLAVPLLLFFTGKLRELAIAHRQLTVIASMVIGVRLNGLVPMNMSTESCNGV